MVCLALAGLGICLVADAADVPPSILIEENFEEASLGGRIDKSGNGDSQARLSPSVGKLVVFPGREAEIVEAWDGQALQFRDVDGEGATRLLLSTEEDFVVSGGELEIFLDFRIEEVTSSDPGVLLSVALAAPVRSLFLKVEVGADGGSFVVTDASEATDTSESSVLDFRRGIDIPALRPGTVYQIKLAVSLDQSTYRCQLVEKVGKDIFLEEESLKFLTIPDLTTNRVGRNFLNIKVFETPSSEFRPPLTIDNIVVTHRPSNKQ